MNANEKPQRFINDLLRTDFHKYVDAISSLTLTDCIMQKVHVEIY